MKDGLDEFKKKLADLMEEYNVYITADDEYMGYPECGEDIQIKLNIHNSVSDEDGFGGFLDAEKLRKSYEKTK